MTSVDSFLRKMSKKHNKLTVLSYRCLLRAFSSKYGIKYKELDENTLTPEKAKEFSKTLKKSTSKIFIEFTDKYYRYLIATSKTDGERRKYINMLRELYASW